MSWLTLPFEVPRRALDDLQSVADSVLEIPALLRELAKRLRSMDEGMDRVSTAIVNVEDELQGVLNAVDPLADEIRGVRRAAEPLDDDTVAVHTAVKPLAGEMRKTRRRSIRWPTGWRPCAGPSSPWPGR